MILWCDGVHDVVENMRRDRVLLDAFERSARSGVRREAVLRLFAFEPEGITLGHAQDPSRELDLARCREDGVRWAIRPTGGRAIFHAQEWTYSLASTLSDPDWGGSLAEAYDRASALIRASLARLGVPAVLARGVRPVAPEIGSAGACFASTARHEILAADRKLVGSAQRRTAWVLLQQGSVLIGPGHRRLADYLAIAGERRERVRDRLRKSTAEAGTWLGSDATLERWAAALSTELGRGVRSLKGAEGAFLLTLPESDLYTPSAS